MSDNRKNLHWTAPRNSVFLKAQPTPVPECLGG